MKKYIIQRSFSRALRLAPGFTLIELLVVVAIIGVLSTIVLAALNTSRNKGIDAAVKSNLANARGQAEIFYSLNTAAPNSYYFDGTENVCKNGTVGPASGIGAMVLAAAKATGLPSYDINNSAGLPTDATCNASQNAWAAEAPLKTSGQFWCVDSSGKSLQTAGSTLGSPADVTCN